MQRSHRESEARRQNGAREKAGSASVSAEPGPAAMPAKGPDTDSRTEPFYVLQPSGSPSDGSRSLHLPAAM